MRGSSRVRPKDHLAVPGSLPSTPQTAPAQQADWFEKPKVLFVCIGNSCRSQMAETFALRYGADVIEVKSAGVAPATGIAPATRNVMKERGLSMEGQFPKGLEVITQEAFDIVVNMSGQPLAIPASRILNWRIKDPIGYDETVHRAVAGQIEDLVMRLVLELRNATAALAAPPPGA